MLEIRSNESAHVLKTCAALLLDPEWAEKFQAATWRNFFCKINSSSLFLSISGLSMGKLNLFQSNCILWNIMGVDLSF